MACFSPIQAFRNPYDSNGPLIFSSHTIGSHDVAVGVYGLKIPCGQCVGCPTLYPIICLRSVFRVEMSYILSYHMSLRSEFVL